MFGNDLTGLLATSTIMLAVAIVPDAAWAQKAHGFPQRIIENSDLLVKGDDAVSTTLSVDISATTTTIPVTSSAGFVAPGLVRIDREVIAFCRASVYALTVGSGS